MLKFEIYIIGIFVFHQLVYHNENQFPKCGIGRATFNASEDFVILIEVEFYKGFL